MCPLTQLREAKTSLLPVAPTLQVPHRLGEEVLSRSTADGTSACRCKGKRTALSPTPRILAISHWGWSMKVKCLMLIRAS